MKRIWKLAAPALLAFGLSACATAPEAPGPAPAEVTYLSDAEFKVMWDEAAFRTRPAVKADEAFIAMLARNDLTPEQRGDVYYRLAFTRGLFVREYPLAFPQCSVIQYAEVAKVMPDHPRLEEVRKEVKYQYDRFHYFTDAPDECKKEAEVLRPQLLK